MSTNAFGMTDAPQPFDLDAWIDGAKLPEKAVTVYGRADLVAEHHELSQQLQAANSGPSLDDDRMVGSPSGRLAQQIRDVEEQMRKSALTFRFRAILDGDIEAAKKAHPSNENARAYFMLTKQVVHPQVSEAQWPKIRERIGEGQFEALLNTAAEASHQRQISVPFSLAASAALSTQDS
jgi:hypothetical protein